MVVVLLLLVELVVVEVVHSFFLFSKTEFPVTLRFLSSKVEALRFT